MYLYMVSKVAWPEMTIWKKHSTKFSFWEDTLFCVKISLLRLECCYKKSWHRKCHFSFIYNLKTTPEPESLLYSSSTQTTGSFVSQSRLVMPRFLPLEMNFKVSPCLNKQIYLATLAELANDTSDSVIPMILQPSHKGWHQKLFSLCITFYKVKIEKLYPGILSECPEMEWMP